MDKARTILSSGDHLRYASDEYDVASDARALLVVTEWPRFARLRLDRLHQVMNSPVVIDGRNLFNPKQMAAAGFRYYSMGRPPAEPTLSSCPDRWTSSKRRNGRNVLGA
jgi:UDPglucose 6-dehydrogenase